MSDTTWRIEITLARSLAKDESPVVAMTCTEPDLDVVFDGSYGCVEGKPFTLWTKQRVYFPTAYDGSEGVSSAPRNPCDEAMG